MDGAGFKGDSHLVGSPPPGVGQGGGLPECAMEAVGEIRAGWSIGDRQQFDRECGASGGPGKKNDLFLGSENGGRRGGVVYPLRVSAGLQGLEPLAYLNDALSPVGTHPCKQPEESPPRNGKPAAKSKKLSPEIYSTRNIGFSPSTQNTKCQDGIARRLTNLNTFA